MLFEPVNVAGATLRNRLIMGSMHTGLEEEPDGYQRMARFYADRARGGAGLIVTGGVSPNSEGKLGLGFEKTFPECAEQHRVITDAVHEAGGHIILQLLHAGRYSKHDNAVAPSNVPSPINRNLLRALSDADVDRTIADYAESARLARQVGYDGVEVMGSEGYLISQFLAERTNHRDAPWGGSWSARKQFAIEAVRAVHEAMGPDAILMFRISVLELVEGGMSGDEIVDLAREVEQAGANLLDSGIGWHEARIPTIMFGVPHGAFAWATRRVREAVSIPVAACNRINRPDVANALLEQGDADLVSMARPWLADAQFGVKAERNDADQINTCIACNQACLDAIFSGDVVSCLVNPQACREQELELVAADHVRRYAVVGAGPGGMMTALTLAQRGHQVELYEADEELGGQFNLARRIPGKEDYGETIRFFRNQFSQYPNLKVNLGSRVESQELVDNGFDSVVLATGITPRTPDVPGIDSSICISYVDLLTGRRQAGKRVAIVGAGGIGFDVAEFLTRDVNHGDIDQYHEDWSITYANDVSGGLGFSNHTVPSRTLYLCQRGARFGRTLGKSTGWALRTALDRRGVEFVGSVTYQRIDDSGLTIEVNGQSRLLEVDTIVICAGQESRRELQHGLEVAGLTTYLIGGAEQASGLDARRAMEQGYRLGLQL